MKRIAVLGVCLCLFPYCAITAFAEEQPSKQTQGANISVSIPEQYTITVIAPKGAEASLNDGATSTITVDRFGEFDFEIVFPNDSKAIEKGMFYSFFPTKISTTVPILTICRKPKLYTMRLLPNSPTQATPNKAKKLSPLSKVRMFPYVIYLLNSQTNPYRQCWNIKM